MHPAAHARADSFDGAARMTHMHSAALARDWQGVAQEVTCACRCGPARHAMALQQQTGAKGAAMDNSAAMLAYAEQLAGKAGAQLQLVDGDMQSFELEVGKSQQLQAAGCLADLTVAAGQ